MRAAEMGHNLTVERLLQTKADTINYQNKVMMAIFVYKCYYHPELVY